VAETAAAPRLLAPTLRLARRSPNLPQGWRLIVLVFLPFAAGLYLTYLFRSINALISGELRSDFGLGAADLGLLTSVYFLTLAAAQIPIGVFLDRYGPRRVQSALLLIAAVGAALFATSQGFILLTLARALIGLGVAAALTAGLKAIVLWFPKERVAIVNGYMLMLGALGTATATAPAELLLAWMGWRGLFELLAVATAASAVVTFLVVPEAVCAAPMSKGSAAVSLKSVYADRRFWRLAPLSATCIGTAWALQGLWAAPWLTDVEGLEREDVIWHLFAMAMALSAGAFLLGIAVDRLGRRGIGPNALFAVVATVFIAAQLALILRVPWSSYWLWSLVAVVGAGTVLSNAILADYFPKEVAGRANGALNVFHFGGAFAVQYAIGLVVAQWTSPDRHYPVIAYQIALGLNLTLQVAALAWFELPRIRKLASFLAWGRLGRALFRASHPLDLGTPYRRAARGWAGRLDSARAQALNWRLAALGSISLSAVLGVALAVSAGRAGVTPYVMVAARQGEARTINPIETNTPSEAQIAYFLTRFVNNVRSLSVDPIVVRASWTDALNYVTDRGARMLNEYAREEDPFTKIGLRTVTVEVIYVVRTSNDSFEMSWKERAYQGGAVVRTDRFTGIANLVFKVPTTAETIGKNPLGVYVNAFNWSRHAIENDTQ
jgi:type IV secretory pathway TrbF-like protein/sugar phosphate permease